LSCAEAFAGRASAYPPSAPRWLRTSPARRSSPRIASTNLRGIPCSVTIVSIFTSSGSRAARLSNARTA